MENSLKVFLSHASVDFKKMEKFADLLESKGYLTWYAPRDILYGDNYSIEILDAIDQVDFVILLHSEHVQSSDYVDKEIEYAVGKKTEVLPIMIDDAPVARKVEFYLRTKQMLFMSQYDSVEHAVEDIHQRMLGNITSYWTKNIQDNSIILGHLRGLKVDETELAKIKQTYVQVKKFEQCVLSLRNDRIIILQHEQEIGKYTTGVSILQKQEIKQIVGIHEPTNILELLKVPLEQHTGYIIKNIDLAFFNGFTLTVWNELKTKLQNTNSYLVLTTNSSEIPKELDFININVPDPVQLLKNYVQQHMGSNSIRIDFTPEILQYANGASPSEIVKMAKQLIPYFRGDVPFQEVEQHLGKSIERKIINWFKKYGTSLDLVSHFVVLSVLKETTDRSYIKAVNSLKRCLQNDMSSNQLSLLTGAEKMEVMFAKRLNINLNTDIGYLTEEGIQLKNKDDQSRIILFTFWDMFRVLRHSFLNWFEEMLLSANNKEKNEIEETIAELANKNLSIIRHDLLQKWAKHDDLSLRISTVKILLCLVEKHGRVREVSNLINSWIYQNKNTALQWTATYALGSKLGYHLYSKSFVQLKHVYQRNKKSLQYVVNQSFSNLYQLGANNQEYDEKFFTFFNEWLIEEKQQNRIVSEEFIKLFFNTIKQRNVSLFSTYSPEQTGKILGEYMAEALSDTKTKDYALNLLEQNSKVHPEKISQLIKKLLNHHRTPVKERTKLWFAEGIEANNTHILNLFREIKN